MSKSIYEETLTELEMWKSTEAYDIEQLEKIDEHIEVMKKAQKQEKLLELYEKLAEHRLRFINEVLDDITYLADFDPTYNKDDIDDIMVEAKKHGDEDTKIVKEIAKIKEIENE